MSSRHDPRCNPGDGVCRCVEGMCGYSNCFREAVAMRGFMKVCARHLAEPRKWGADGKTYTGTVWRGPDAK